MSNNLQSQFETIIFSGELKAANVFQVNPTYFYLPDNGIWIVDGGIELVFLDGTFCIAWSSDYEFFVFENNVFEALYLQQNFVQLNTENNLNQFIGHKVISAEFKTIDIETVVDYTMRTETEKRFVEVVLKFDNNTHLQIALVNYDLEQNESPKNFRADPYAALLISTKEIITIGAYTL